MDSDKTQYQPIKVKLANVVKLVNEFNRLKNQTSEQRGTMAMQRMQALQYVFDTLELPY